MQWCVLLDPFGRLAGVHFKYYLRVYYGQKVAGQRSVFSLVLFVTESLERLLQVGHLCVSVSKTLDFGIKQVTF